MVLNSSVRGWVIGFGYIKDLNRVKAFALSSAGLLFPESHRQCHISQQREYPTLNFEVIVVILVFQGEIYILTVYFSLFYVSRAAKLELTIDF